VSRLQKVPFSSFSFSWDLCRGLPTESRYWSEAIGYRLICKKRITSRNVTRRSKSVTSYSPQQDRI
jgi:hypothetical protein